MRNLRTVAGRGWVAMLVLLLVLGTMGEGATAKHRGQGDLQPKIVGGTVVPAGGNPFMAAILDTSRGSTAFDQQFCGGSVLSPSWVLTAAHCVTSGSGGVVPATGLAVLVGRQNLSATGGDTVPVATVYRHPSYNASTFSDDVALLKLSRPITTIFSKPIKMVASGVSLYEQAGRAVTVSGWGATNASGTSYPTALYQANVNVVSDATCGRSNVYGSNFVAATMLCASYSSPPRDSCFGDSGGPLFAIVNNAPVQVGVVSWGYGCAKPAYPGVYAQLSNSTINNWIVTTTGGAVTTVTRDAKKHGHR